MRGARALEEHDPEETMALYFDALDIYESESKEAYSSDTFRHAIAFLIRQERWADAVEVQMRFGAVSDKVGAKYSQNKAYLGGWGRRAGLGWPVEGVRGRGVSVGVCAWGLGAQDG